MPQHVAFPQWWREIHVWDEPTICEILHFLIFTAVDWAIIGTIGLKHVDKDPLNGLHLSGL